MDTIEQTSPHLRYRAAAAPRPATRAARFKDVSASAGEVFPRAWAARGLAVGDLDDDGDQDVVVTTVEGRPYVLRNDGGNRGHWITLRLVGRRSNRDGIGARCGWSPASGALRLATVDHRPATFRRATAASTSASAPKPGCERSRFDGQAVPCSGCTTSRATAP